MRHLANAAGRQPAAGGRDVEAKWPGGGALLAAAALAIVLVLPAAARAQVQPPAQAAASPGPLSAAHAPLEGSCEMCHEPGGELGASRCLSCHDPIARRIAAGKGVHREVGEQCLGCHAEHGGVDAELRPLDPAGFDHASETGFALVGFHAPLSGDCARCHKTRSFLELSPACASCHSDPHRGAMANDCTSCHEPTRRWNIASRAFHKAGLFPLEGRHLDVPCASCHLDGVTWGTPTECADCHWARRQDDPYQTRLGTQCGECHRPISWTAVTWNHAARTGFPLNAAHAVLACENCHENRIFANTRMDCFGCHAEAFRRTRDPNHVEAGFPTDCEACHRAADTSWRGASFNHAQVFPLAGAHATLACAACHRNGVYRGTPRECVGCHEDDYQRTRSPNHAAAGFPTDCGACHRASDTSWRGASFNHAQVFPLVGVHAAQPCTACHANAVYAGTPRDCVGCHRDDYDRTRDPAHASAGFPTTCEGCHSASASSWTASFDHNQFYPLLGRHRQQPCSACHSGGRYEGTPRDCYPCHRSDYERTRDPNHVVAGFPVTCESCHRASDGSWDDGRFNHTWFPITSGPHAGHACSACHVDAGSYAVFSCTVCHSAPETSPEHSHVSGYRYDSQACYACHPNGRAD